MPCKEFIFTSLSLAFDLPVKAPREWYHFQCDQIKVFRYCRAHLGLPVGFLLLRYSVLCTVESLSLLYLLFKS